MGGKICVHTGQIQTHIDTEDNSPKCMMEQGGKTCDMIAKSRQKENVGSKRKNIDRARAESK